MKKIYKAIYVCILFFVVSTFVKAQCTFTTTVPYFENFAAISTGSPLPPCWSTQGLAATSTTATNKFAYFYFSPQGSNYFFTNGIQLNAGIIYSVSIFYLTDFIGNTNWSNFSVLLGSAQSTTGLVTIASTPGPAVATVFTALSNTFTVNSSGIYYAAIKGTSNGSGSAYLSWDDFSITVPCALNPVFLNASSSSSVLCQGQSAVLTASGANTYTWNNGANTSIITVTPNANLNYIVNATNSLGCVASKTIIINVNPVPSAAILTNKSAICEGESTTLLAISGPTASHTYSWSNGSTSYSTAVSPSVTTNYTVTVTNSLNCSSSAIHQQTVNPLPTISYFVNSNFVCAGDEITISLMGANTYNWFNNSGTVSGNSSQIVRKFSTNEWLVVTGTDGNGCSRTFTLNLNVNECAGLYEKTLANRLSLFPNPTNQLIHLIGLNQSTSIEVFDLKGMLVYSISTNDRAFILDLNKLDHGLYLLRIKSGNETVQRKIIKD